MELIEIDKETVQELFHTAWQESPTRGLCKWVGKTYLWTLDTSEIRAEGDICYILPVTVSDIIEIEVDHKHLYGIVWDKSSFTNSDFIPTLKLISLLLPNIPDRELWRKSVHWWVKQKRGGRDYTANKKPIAFWRGNGPVQQIFRPRY